MTRPALAVLLLVLGGCHSTSDEPDQTVVDPVNGVFSEEELPAEWQAFVEINAEYFRGLQSEPPAAPQAPDEPHTRTTPQTR